MKKVEVNSEELKKLLDGKHSQKEIAKVFGLKKRQAIAKRIKEYNLSHLPTKGKWKSFNENYFETIDNEEKAYWLGMIAADGSLYTPPPRYKRKRINLSLAEKDLKHLKKFGKAIEANFEPRKRSRKLNGKVFYRYRYLLSSNKMYYDLINKGILERKSLVLEPPKNVSMDLIRHWIRGYFDGDGCIHLNKYKRGIVSIAGTESVMNFIKEIVGFGWVNCSIKGRKNPLYSYRVNSMNEVEKFMVYLYKGSTISLDRKRKIFGGVYGPLN